jgi:outer membrane receptor for ferrienterochelin and colicins
MSMKSILAATAAVSALAVSTSAQEILLADAAAGNIETVVVSAQRNFRPGALKSDIVKTEVLSADQIEKMGALNVNQALDNNPGIQVQVECSICNVRNITLDHLPGRFTTLMIDGVPLFSSLSSAYGHDSVNVRGIEQIEVSRGAGASLISPDALAGAVNIVTKKPEGFELEADIGAGEDNKQTANVYVGDTFGPHLSGTLTASFNKQSTVDADGDKLSEFTGFTRYMVGTALFGDFGNISSKLRLDYIDEKRGGGAMGGDYGATRASYSGNPFDWSRGPHASARADGWYAVDGCSQDNNPNPADPHYCLYDDGAGGMSEIIFTKRFSALGTVTGKFAPKLDWRIAYGYARNSQHSFYEGTGYNANGNQAYSEISVHYRAGKAVFTLGGNFRYEDLDSISSKPVEKLDTGWLRETVHGLDNYVYRTPGAFAQFYDALFDETLEVNASVRYDHNSTFGSIWSPRLNLLWHHTPSLSSRLSLGRGYRAPTSFFEQDHGILDTTQIVRLIDDPETSDNLSYALNYSDDRLSATLAYNFNQIKHFALLDPEGTIRQHGTEENVTWFTQAEHAVIIQGLDGTVSYQLLPSLMVAVGGERYFYAFDPGTLAFSQPDWRLFFSGDWTCGDLDLFARVTVTGPHNLKKFYDYADTQRYNFDGTPKLDKSPTFATVDVKASYALTDTVSLYLGADNLFDYSQADKEDPRWVDAHGSFDVTQIWGPMLGRTVYGGVKFSL